MKKDQTLPLHYQPILPDKVLRQEARPLSFIRARRSAEDSSTNLKHLIKAIARTRKPLKNKYKDREIVGIKEWR